MDLYVTVCVGVTSALLGLIALGIVVVIFNAIHLGLAHLIAEIRVNLADGSRLSWGFLGLPGMLDIFRAFAFYARNHFMDGWPEGSTYTWSWDGGRAVWHVPSHPFTLGELNIYLRKPSTDDVAGKAKGAGDV